jgi:hypothetical protein
MILMSLLAVPQTGPESQERDARPLRQIVTQPVFVVAAMSGALGYAVMNLLMTATRWRWDCAATARGRRPA